MRYSSHIKGLYLFKYAVLNVIYQSLKEILHNNMYKSE